MTTSRAAEIVTPHGAIRLPAFLPDATRGVVRGLSARQVRQCGVQGLVVSTFHLMSKPGSTVVQAQGGIHRFMDWSGPVLSDSGGFQIFSLLTQSPGLGGVTRKGVHYRLSRKSGKRLLTPEKCIRKQLQMGADVLVCLDHCTHPEDPAEVHREAVENTVRWAENSRRAFDESVGKLDERPLLFAVVQGGEDAALRGECLERLQEIGFDGYGYGGWPIDQDGRLLDMVSELARTMPSDALRWALGVGKAEHVVDAVCAGYDLLDCTIPTRDARHGRLFVLTGEPRTARSGETDWYGCHYPLDEEHVRADGPVDPGCDCVCCSHYSCGYLRHLFRVRDTLGYALATAHNLRFYTRLMEALRNA